MDRCRRQRGRRHYRSARAGLNASPTLGRPSLGAGTGGAGDCRGRTRRLGSGALGRGAPARGRHSPQGPGGAAVAARSRRDGAGAAAATAAASPHHHWPRPCLGAHHRHPPLSRAPTLPERSGRPSRRGHPQSDSRRAGTLQRGCVGLGLSRLGPVNGRKNLVFFRETELLQLGKHQGAVDRHFKGPTAALDEPGVDPIFIFDRVLQTCSVREVISLCTVCNGNLHTSRLLMLASETVIKAYRCAILAAFLGAVNYLTRRGVMRRRWRRSAP